MGVNIGGVRLLGRILFDDVGEVLFGVVPWRYLVSGAFVALYIASTELVCL